MRTTAIIALIGATQAAADAATCKKDAKAADCTWAVCYAKGTPLSTAKGDYPGCKDTLDDTNYCSQLGTKCTYKICTSDAGKKFKAATKGDATCKTDCLSHPEQAQCWDSTDAADKCLWTGVGCTADICKDHTTTSYDAEKKADDTTAATKANSTAVTKYYWSERCNLKQMHGFKLTALADTDDYNTKASADKKTHSTDKSSYSKAKSATKKAATAVTADKANSKAKATTSKGKAYAKLVKTHTDAVKTEAAAKAKVTLSGQYDTQNTDFAKVLANRLVWAKKDLANVKSEATATKKDATDLQSRDKKHLSAAKLVSGADKCSTSKEKATSPCKAVADWTAQVSADKAAITDNWTKADDWHTTWWNNKLEATKLKSDAVTMQTDAKATQTKAKTALSAAKKAVTKAEAAVTADKANIKAKATTSKGKAYAKLVKTHTTAVSTEAAAQEKVTLIDARVTKADAWVTDSWNVGTTTTDKSDNTDSHHQKWVTNEFAHKTLLSDAKTYQASLVAKNAANKKALSAAKLALTKAKTADKKADTATVTKLTWETDQSADWVKLATAAMANATNQDNWHQNLVESKKTVKDAEAQEATDKIVQAKDCKTSTDKKSVACKQQNAWVAADEKHVKTLKAAAAKTDDKKKSKSAAKEAAAKKDVAATKAAIVKTDAALKTADCSDVKNKDNATCKKLAITKATEEADLKKEEASLKAAEGGGATVGIIIACVAAVLCVGGGAAWYIKQKKSAEDFDDVYSSVVDQA